MSSGNAWQRTGLVATLLIGLNVLAHFLPFERAAVGNDDFAHQVQARNLSYGQIVEQAPRQPDRPLGYIFILGQAKWLDGNAAAGLRLMVLASSAVLLLTFVLLRALFGSVWLAGLGAALFILIPNKLEMYHMPVNVVLDIANILYLSSFILMVRFLQAGRWPRYGAALVLYCLGIVTYEPGFFLPVVLLACALVLNHRRIPHALAFMIPSAIYVVFKMTNAFGWGDAAPMNKHMPDLMRLPHNVMDLAHHYIGRYMARSVIYGGHQFASMDGWWLAVLTVFNLATLALVIVALRRARVPRVDAGLLWIALAVFVGFAMPILLNDSGGVGGRHLVLPSIGVAMVILWVATRLRRAGLPVLVSMMAVSLVVCQGNAWAQVVASRLNAAVYERMQERRGELAEATYVIIDVRSFADRIPFTMVHRVFNVLNTYYGAQAFEDWGLASQVKLVTGRMDLVVHVATERPKAVAPNAWAFSILDHQGYRSATPKPVQVPREGTVVVDYEDVYAHGYRYGKRVPPVHGGSIIMARPGVSE